MAGGNHVENPMEFMFEKATWAVSDVWRVARHELHRPAPAQALEVRAIGPRDVLDALRQGARDLGAARSDVLFLALIYPLAGLVLARAAFDLNLLPLLVPLASGFALLGPVAALGLYEISRRLERGEPVSVAAAFEALRTPALGSILGLGSILLLLFAAWLGVAWGVYAVTLGPAPPASFVGFFRAVFETPAGWAMIGLGTAIGFLFAAAVFAISVFAFPLMLDRDVGMATAVKASLAAIRRNPAAMLLWAAIVAGGLILGSIPLLIGLVVIMPMLGHATWRLYRKTFAAPGA